MESIHKDPSSCQWNTVVTIEINQNWCDNHISTRQISVLALTFSLGNHNGANKLNKFPWLPSPVTCLCRIQSNIGITLPMSCLCLLTSTGVLSLIDIIAKAWVADLITCILVLRNASVPLPTDTMCCAYITAILAYTFHMFTHYDNSTLSR
jgi:hypothetical protein